jgi:DeoR/GlpR family transcriptional regulator of sugar metabolism
VAGYRTLEMLTDINIDMAFIGVSGCSLDAGFTCGTEADSLVKKLVIQKARTSVLMCGTEKLKCLMPYTFATFGDVNYIVCDQPLPEAYETKARESGVIIL